MISRSVQIVRMAFFFFDLLNRVRTAHPGTSVNATLEGRTKIIAQAAARPPMQAKRRTSQFFSTRQLSPAAFSELHTLAAAFIDTKGPIEAR